MAVRGTPHGGMIAMSRRPSCVLQRAADKRVLLSVAPPPHPSLPDLASACVLMSQAQRYRSTSAANAGKPAGQTAGSCCAHPRACVAKTDSLRVGPRTEATSAVRPRSQPYRQAGVVESGNLRALGARRSWLSRSLLLRSADRVRQRQLAARWNTHCITRQRPGTVTKCGGC